MATNRINLSTTQYVRINIGYSPLIIEAINGDVHVVLNKNQPSTENSSFHKLTDRQRLEFRQIDTNVWVLAKSSNTRAIVSELNNAGTKGGIGSGLTEDAWGIPKVSIPRSLIHGLFTFNIPPSMWFSYEDGVQVYTPGNITSVGGAAHIVADAVSTVSLLESRETPRYQPNRGHLFSTAGWFPNKLADGERDFGLFTAENGVHFRLKTDGLLYAVRRTNGAVVQEELIDTSILTGFDVEMNNIYDIQYQWRSAGNYHFYIGDPATGASKMVHHFKLLGTVAATTMENPALPVAFKATRITEDVVMNIGCDDVTSENGLTDTEQYESAYSEDATVNGTDVPILVIRQPLTINSQVNTRTVTLARVTAKCAKKATIKVWATRDPSSIVGATFVAINDVSKLKFITAIPVEANVSREVDNPHRGRIEFPIVRGDYLVVTGTASTTVATAIIEWGEQI